MSEFVERVSLIVAPEVMQEANDTQSFNLAKPDSGVKNGRNKHGETATWTELLNVLGSDLGVVPEGVNADGDPTPKRVFVDVKFAVAPETLDPKNVGRTLRQRYLINAATLGTREPSKERTMSLMSIGKLNAFLRAAGFEIEPGVQTELADYFEANVDGESQVTGTKVYADFRNYTDKNGIARQDIIAYDGVDSNG